MKVSTKVKETPDQIAARQAEEARIAAAEAKSQSQEITALGRNASRRTRQVIRAFGARNATAAFGGLGGLAAAASGGATVTGGGVTGGMSYDFGDFLASEGPRA